MKRSATNRRTQTLTTWLRIVWLMPVVVHVTVKAFAHESRNTSRLLQTYPDPQFPAKLRIPPR
eukprot:4756185-Amphidinium_carterae.1